MNTSEKNSYLIIYVLLDFVRYVKELEKAATTDEEQKRIHEQCDLLQNYCGLYLKQTLGEREVSIFLKEIQDLLA